MVAKCLLTTVWSYEYYHADSSIRVSDCSIRVSQSGNSIMLEFFQE